MERPKNTDKMCRLLKFEEDGGGYPACDAGPEASAATTEIEEPNGQSAWLDYLDGC